eukprot:c11596_g1_i1 orf=577-1980(+)
MESLSVVGATTDLETSSNILKPHQNGDKHSTKQDAPDAGALFVLESKGTWVHAGYHLTTSIAAPALLSLPFAFAGLGWTGGVLLLLLDAALSFYNYCLLSRVLEHLASIGRRHLRFRDLACDVLGRKWSLYTVAPVQFSVCFGAVIGCSVLGGQSMKLIYSIYHDDGSMKLYDFIIIFGLVMLLLSQLPSFHSLRYINLLSLLMCLGYSALAVGGSIYAGRHHSTPKDYSLQGGSVSKMFGVFNACAVIATTFGNGIIPEIQATLAPPVSGKMFKGLCVCYTVVISTFFSVAVSGYWAFGNKSSGNLMSNFAPSGQPALVPNWLNFLANMFILTQLFAVALVYSQPMFEVLEGRASDGSVGRFSFRNLLPRLLLRGTYIALATLISAMIPFFGDINGLIGAFGFLPLDFIFPVIFYNLVFKPSRRSLIFWANTLIASVSVLVCVLGSISAVRQIALDAKSYKLFANL